MIVILNIKIICTQTYTINLNLLESSVGCEVIILTILWYMVIREFNNNNNYNVCSSFGERMYRGLRRKCQTMYKI